MNQNQTAQQYHPEPGAAELNAMRWADGKYTEYTKALASFLKATAEKQPREELAWHVGEVRRRRAAWRSAAVEAEPAIDEIIRRGLSGNTEEDATDETWTINEN